MSNLVRQINQGHFSALAGYIDLLDGKTNSKSNPDKKVQPAGAKIYKLSDRTLLER